MSQLNSIRAQNNKSLRARSDIAAENVSNVEICYSSVNNNTSVAVKISMWKTIKTTWVLETYIENINSHIRRIALSLFQ